jgi:hypothetical protein
MALALATALIVTSASILADFWVFPRQWIASQALVLAALPWLASQLLTGGKSAERAAPILLTLSALLLLPTILITGAWKASQIREWVTNHAKSEYASLTEDQLRNLLDGGETPPNRVWTEFAEANLIRNGPVWPTLGRYYTDRDWSSVTLEVPKRDELFLE